MLCFRTGYFNGEMRICICTLSQEYLLQWNVYHTVQLSQIPLISIKSNFGQILKIESGTSILHVEAVIWVTFPVQVIWALSSSFEILMAYLIVPRAGWRILVLVSALPMIFSIFSAWVCSKPLIFTFCINVTSHNVDKIWAMMIF